MASRAIGRTSGSRWLGFYSPRRGRVGTALQARAPPLLLGAPAWAEARTAAAVPPCPAVCTFGRCPPPPPPLPRAQPGARSQPLPTVCRGGPLPRLPACLQMPTRRQCTLPASESGGREKGFVIPQPFPAAYPFHPPYPLF